MRLALRRARTRLDYGMENGIDSFLSFSVFSPKRQRLLVAGKTVFCASSLAGSDCHLKSINHQKQFGPSSRILASCRRI